MAKNKIEVRVSKLNTGSDCFNITVEPTDGRVPHVHQMLSGIGNEIRLTIFGDRGEFDHLIRGLNPKVVEDDMLEDPEAFRNERADRMP